MSGDRGTHRKPNSQQVESQRKEARTGPIIRLGPALKRSEESSRLI